MKTSVCFVSLSAYGYFNPEITPGGGAQRQLYLLSQELRKDFDIHFVVGDYGQDLLEHRDGVTLHRAYRPRTGTTTDEQLGNLVQLIRAIRRADSDLYVYRGGPKKAILTSAIAKVLGANWAYNLSNDSNVDTDPDDLLAPGTWLFRRALTQADGVIAQTKYQQQRLDQRFGVQSHVIPNGYPSANSSEPVPYDERDGFLWVGRIDKHQKRPNLYLDLAETIPTERFLLIGTPDNNQTFYHSIRDRASSIPNVEFIGEVHPTEIHEYYRNTVALINTSAYEGFPNTFLEAWRQRTPVISLDIDPRRYIEIQKARGCDGEFDNLLSRVRRVSSERNYWNSIAGPVYNYFENNLTIQIIAKKYGNLLQDAAES